MNTELNFWQAIGSKRQQIMHGLIAAVLVFIVLPIFFDEDFIMALYATVFGLYALGDCALAVFQLIKRDISAVVFIYRLWHGFAVMLLLVSAFMLAGLAMTFYR